VFCDVASGEILVSDVDNVGVDDGTSRVLGTGAFMAPEIVVAASGTVLPSTLTDRHSLAVLLFHLLFGEHPLEGARTAAGLRTEEHHRRHFGEDPLFCLHPTDAGNRPVAPAVGVYWERVYPSWLTDPFTEAFTAGLADPARRVPESRWERVLRRARDVMGACPACGATVFHEPAGGRVCWSCEAPLPSPGWVGLGDHRLAVGPHLEITADHLGDAGPDDEEAVLARAVAHPADAGRIGLANLSRRPWGAVLPDGRGVTVAPGRAVDAVPGLRLDLLGRPVVVLP
jgi:hypothetical protein